MAKFSYALWIFVLHQDLFLFAKEEKGTVTNQSTSEEDRVQYLNNSQFAYRSGGSCVNALLKMQHTFLAPLDLR